MPALRSIRLTLVAVTLVAMTAGCTSGKERASFSGGVDTSAVAEPQLGPSTSTTVLTLTAVVLAPDGLGPVSFGTQAARAVHAMTDALGRADDVTAIPAEANCDATRLFRWKDLDVLINEVSGRLGGKPGIVGWSVGVAASSPLGLRTEKGIGLGSTVAAVKAAYGPTLTITQGGSGPSLMITTPSGIITGEFDGLGESSRVKTLRAGVACAI